MTNEMKLLIDEFVLLCQRASDAWHDKLQYVDNPKFTIEDSRKYIRIKVGGCIYGFIDATNGDLLKAATWRAPAKYARGSLYQRDTWEACIGTHSLDKDVREENRQEKKVEESIIGKSW